MDPQPVAKGEKSKRAFLFHRRLLGQRLALHFRIRLGVALFLLLSAALGSWVLRIEGFSALPLTLIAVLVYAYNRGLQLLLSADVETRPTRGEIERAMTIAVALDFLALTACTYFLGGARSPFLAFYLIHIMLVSILLERRRAILLTGLAYLLLCLLTLGEWSGLLVPPPALLGLGHSSPIGLGDAATILIAAFLLFASVSAVLLSLIHHIRTNEARLLESRAALGRLSEFRKDFLHITLHNIQSPIGVASIHIENILKGYGGELTEQQRNWLERSLARLGGMSEFLHDLRTISKLESASLEEELVDVDLGSIAAELSHEFQEEAGLHRHKLVTELPESLTPVRGVPRLIREALANFITNAIKYTPEGGRIVIRGKESPHAVTITVEDNGVGIEESVQRTLFSEFVRHEHKGTAVEHAQGTGLGLSIAKRVTEAHGGTVSVESVVGEGSRFAISLPVPQPA